MSATNACGDTAPFVDAAGPTDATVFACPLCGARFSHGARVCGACPLAGGCDIVRCPHCAYAFPRSSRIVEWFRRRFTARRRNT
jgi:predicted amidophosphoribosyltransferase